jgi:hypothetical protein
LVYFFIFACTYIKKKVGIRWHLQPLFILWLKDEFVSFHSGGDNAGIQIRLKGENTGKTHKLTYYFLQKADKDKDDGQISISEETTTIHIYIIFLQLLCFSRNYYSGYQWRSYRPK